MNWETSGDTMSQTGRQMNWETGRQMNSETRETSEDRQPESRTPPRGKSRTALEKELRSPVNSLGQSKSNHWVGQKPPTKLPLKNRWWMDGHSIGASQAFSSSWASPGPKNNSTWRFCQKPERIWKTEPGFPGSKYSYISITNLSPILCVFFFWIYMFWWNSHIKLCVFLVNFWPRNVFVGWMSHLKICVL